MDNSRSKTIIRASVIGILVNVMLAGFKAFIGMLSNSVAITVYEALRQTGFPGLQDTGEMALPRDPNTTDKTEETQ